MKGILLILASAMVALASYAEPKITSISNHDHRVTVILTDDDAAGRYEISKAKLVNNFKEEKPKSTSVSVSNGRATIVLEFPFATQFYKTKVVLWINGKKYKVKAPIS